MLILVQSNNSVDTDANFAATVEEDVAQALSRFSDDLTRVEVHLMDQSASREGAQDLKCSMEARPAGKKPLAVTNTAATPEEAYHGATQKLVHLLETSQGKTRARRGRDSIRHMPAD